MATFQAQIEGLTGLTITGSSNPTQTQLTQFLQDGVKEVTARLIVVKPSLAQRFTRVTSELTSNGHDLGAADVISVVREDGTVNSWRECRQISPAKQTRVTDISSLDYASKYNPTYIRWDDGKITVYPAPTTSPNRFKIFYVNNVPTFSGGSNTYDSTTIHYFPDNQAYLVILHASMKSLQNALAGETLPSNIIIPTLSAYSESLPTFTAPDDFVMPATPADIDINLSSITPVLPFVKPVLITAPTYTAPVLSLDAKPSITDLTISSIVPIAPVLDSTSVATNTGTNPTFAAPVMNAPDWSDVNNWISVEEDSEMSTARVDEIATKITEYNARLSEAQLAFNEESTVLNKDLEIAIQNADIYESSKLTKYASEIEAYKESVIQETEEWQSNYTKDLALWQQNNGSILQKYQLDMQNALNDFNKEVIEYQSTTQSDIQNEVQRVTSSIQIFQYEMQKVMTTYELETKLDLSIYQAQIQANLQKFQTDLAKQKSIFDNSMARYLHEMQKVAGDNQNKIEKLNSEIQNYTAQINKSSINYQWIQGRYAILKQQYDEAFIMMAPQQQQQQQQQVRR